MTQYSDKLRDPRWQKKRLEILQRDEFRCQECTDDSTTLHVHHTRYMKGRDPWDYPSGFLVTLCEHCHEQMHANPVSVIEQLAGSFYEHGASWSILWGLAAILDFGCPRDHRFTYAEWDEMFHALEGRMHEIVARGPK